MLRIKHSSPLLPEAQKGKVVFITIDGKYTEAYEGETVAAAMLAAGIRTFKHSQTYKQPRGLYCGMGICYECLVIINGLHAQRACITPVSDGMQIETCRGLKL